MHTYRTLTAYKEGAQELNTVLDEAKLEIQNPESLWSVTENVGQPTSVKETETGSNNQGAEVLAG